MFHFIKDVRDGKINIEMIKKVGFFLLEFLEFFHPNGLSYSRVYPVVIMKLHVTNVHIRNTKTVHPMVTLNV